MKNKLKLNIAVLLFFTLSNLQAQTALPATGGEANGSGGSASYTVGQVVYTTNIGTNGNSLAQGVQQAYEISVVTNINETENADFSLSAYPNPVNDFLTLKTDNLKITNLSYRLCDINGKLIRKRNITADKTKIETNNLPPAIYFLYITDNKKNIKTFKIIKN